MSETLTIVLVSDGKYLVYLKPLIMSVITKCPNYEQYLRFHLHLVNVDNQQDHDLCAWLAKHLSKELVTFSSSTEKLDPKSRKVKPKRSEKDCFCANIRIKVMNDLLKEGKQYLLYMDVDSLILKDLRVLFEMIKQNDIVFRTLLVIPPELKKSPASKSGVIGVNGHSPIMRELMEEFDQMMQEEGYRIWGNDQLYLHQLCHEKYKDRIKYFNFGQAYLDWEFEDDSTIWVGKGSRKKKSVKYKKLEGSFKK